MKMKLSDVLSDLKKVVEEFPEFEDDLDNMACSTGWGECRVCGGGGYVDPSFKKKIRNATPAEHKPDCAWKRLIDLAGEKSE